MLHPGLLLPLLLTVRASAARAGPAGDLAAAAVVTMWDLEPTFETVLAAAVVMAGAIWGARRVLALLGGGKKGG